MRRWTHLRAHAHPRPPPLRASPTCARCRPRPVYPRALHRRRRRHVSLRLSTQTPQTRVNPTQGKKTAAALQHAGMYFHSISLADSTTRALNQVSASTGPMMGASAKAAARSAMPPPPPPPSLPSLSRAGSHSSMASSAAHRELPLDESLFCSSEVVTPAAGGGAAAGGDAGWAAF